jgi:hypothetical protein
MRYKKRNIEPVADDNRFLVETPVVTDRIADYKRGEYVNKAFTSMTKEEVLEFYKTTGGTNGNLHPYFIVEKATKSVLVVDDWKDERARNVYDEDSKFISLSSAISSSLAMYRLVCMLNKPHIIAEGAMGYKVPWEIYLKHKKTGEVVCFSEWKGAFGFRTRLTDIKSAPEEFINDIKFVLDLMFSNNSPHPYDETVAGSCA